MIGSNRASILWIIGIVIVINLLAQDFFFRIDTTEDKTYTLGKATKDILKNLEEPITVTAYFTEGLPPQYGKTLTDFQDLLKEYSTRSQGMVNFEFINPNESPESEQEAAQNGISPLLINAREKDEVIQKRAFMGAVLKSGEAQEIIPFIQPEGAMEYELTTSIKKLSVLDKPTIGLVQGNGEPGIEEIGPMYQALSILYEIENIDLNEEIPARHKTVLFLNPQDSMNGVALSNLDNYLGNGGNLCLAFNSVEGNFQTVQGEAKNTGLQEWLRPKGIDIPNSFVLDANCGSISVQQRQGFFNMTSQVQFPFIPLINKFEEHPITKGVDQVVFPFASPMTYNETDPAFSFTPLVTSSSKSSIQTLPVYFDVQRKWRDSDFPMGAQTIAGILEGDYGNTGIPSKMIIFSDGDFAQQGGSNNSNSDNYNLIVNSVDWLSDDTGLIDLRTKGVSSRPIDDLEEGRKSFLKWLNFLLPLALVAGLGIYRTQRSRSIRNRRLRENYA